MFSIIFPFSRKMGQRLGQIRLRERGDWEPIEKLRKFLCIGNGLKSDRVPMADISDRSTDRIEWERFWVSRTGNYLKTTLALLCEHFPSIIERVPNDETYP